VSVSQLVRELDSLASAGPKDFHPKSEGKVRGLMQDAFTAVKIASGARPHPPISLFASRSLQQLVLIVIRSLHCRYYTSPTVREPAAD
jgi:hypothetical protein